MTYGCFNRKPFKKSYTTIDGKFFKDTEKDGVIEVVLRTREVPFKLSPDCQYTKSALGQRDPGCIGCKHREVKDVVQR